MYDVDNLYNLIYFFEYKYMSRNVGDLDYGLVIIKDVVYKFIRNHFDKTLMRLASFDSFLIKKYFKFLIFECI